MNPDLKAEAIATFTSLLDEARAAGDPEPTAMTLATVGADGRISARVVLLKEVDERGFVFYTNTLSRKGRALAVQPQAALLFHWKTLRDQVQVRIEGSVAPVTVQEADAYFASRPRESQLGAWASLQSEPLAERAVFEARYPQFEQQYADGPVPRPPHWSGYRVAPETFEFWYGVPFRLHERRVYRLQEGIWSTGLLYP